MTEDRSFLFLLGSARAGGNTEMLARRAAKELPRSVKQRWIRTSELPLAPFVDRKHDGDDFVPPAGNERALFDATMAATDLVIASPVYWYSVSASVKLYFDHWAAWLDQPELRFKERMRGKTLWGVSALAERPEQAEPLIGTLRKTAGYLGMHWGGQLLGNGSRPGDVLLDEDALKAAVTFFAGADLVRA
ncbi:flavodoxin family protein [Amycolatopsis regifaucium]|uniref:Flavodoxin n=1 Tax=Amycolatopsis regifaucium TaxID=546365 RepID=A0A154MEQ5_9PSEU|nr:NAD(P)H-dependent oxidoreductase [Amycolatopsis regifaucium]KZB82607.1 flavodoxin [Amycolatopsis regifaucium]OKA06465.1 flavodoxin [Amycolatopsis regifaucium]SFG88201.1 Multimeric flavodoxin WrbA [Amycolatopsis regifaucium]